MLFVLSVLVQVCYRLVSAAKSLQDTSKYVGNIGKQF